MSDDVDHRSLGVRLYNRTWHLLELGHRDPSQDDEMVDAAHASAWHWAQAGSVVHTARARWLCARVYCALGLGEPAVRYGERALALVQSGDDGFADWDLANALQGLGQARHVNGDVELADVLAERTRVALATVRGEDDAAVIRAQLHEWSPPDDVPA